MSMKLALPLVSIIVPVYNVEKYLAECLDSIIDQTYDILEVILVNDCSTDGSGDIANYYAKKDSRIKVIHKSRNEGLYAARLTGLDAAEGDYFTTIDSDDYVDRRYIDELVQSALDKGSDIVSSGGLVFVFPNEMKNYALPFSPKTTESIGSDYQRYIACIADERDGMRWSMCGRLFKRDIFIQAKQHLSTVRSRLIMAEDLLTFSVLVYFAGSSSSTGTYRYYYRQNEESTLNAKDPDIIAGQLADVKLVLKTLRGFIKDVDNYDRYKKSFEEFESNLSAEHEYRASHLTRKFRKNVKPSKKSRILCPSPFGNFNGGGEKSSYVLWRWLNKAYDVIIVLPYDASDEYIEACERDGISYVCGDYMHAVRGGGKAVATIHSFIEEYKPSIVFPSLYFEDAFWAAALTNTPCVFLNYGMFEMLLVDGSSSQDDIIRIGNLLKLSNVVVANSLYGVDASRQYGRGAILAWSYTETPKIKLRTDKKATRLIYPARIDEGKQQLQLIEGIKILRENRIDTQALLLGAEVGELDAPGGYLAVVNQYVESNNLEGVEVLPWKSNPWEEFGANDIYVSTTKSEAVGRATLEAVSLGIPILIPDIQGHREYREVLGMADEHFYIPGDMDDFARKAEYLTTHLEEVKKKVKLYQKRVKEAFNEDACGEALLPALEDIIGKGNPGFYSYVKNIFIDDIVKQGLINSLETENSRLRAELNDKDIELSSHQGIKRSIKLTVDNIKRRARYGKKR